jgi:hypothetical protein
MVEVHYMHCDSCGADRETMFVVHDHVWEAVTAVDERRRMLCFFCTEDRLGRKRTLADLKPCLVNVVWFKMFTEYEEQEASNTEEWQRVLDLYAAMRSDNLEEVKRLTSPRLTPKR